MNEDLYNRICSIIWHEEIRLCNEVTERMNFITKYTPVDPEAYVKLAQAKAKKEYFDSHAFNFLRWLDGFVDSVQ